ncbi:MAG: hypothetical protein NTV93_06045 [Verrucomicrobia bacterium]|nr:hypothetical protein [Verrucomicrobiota bacterium]
MTDLQIGQEFSQLARNFDRKMSGIESEMFWRAEWKDWRAVCQMFNPQQPVEELPLFQWAKQASPPARNSQQPGLGR